MTIIDYSIVKHVCHSEHHQNMRLLAINASQNYLLYSEMPMNVKNVE